MTLTTAQRLEQVRQRLSKARKDRTDFAQALQLAKRDNDEDAVAILESQIENTRDDIERAIALEGALMRQSNGTVSTGISAFEDPETIALMGRIASTTRALGDVPVGEVLSNDQMRGIIESGSWGVPKLAASTVPDTTVGRRGTIDELGVIPQARRRLSILDLIPTLAANGNTVPYIVESGSFDTAAETAEGSAKPVGDIGLTDGENPIRTVAHYLKSKRQILSDVPGVEQTVRNRLIYGVMRRLENQVLSGDGTGQNLTGVLHTSGIGSVAFGAGTPLADLALSGLVAELQSEGQADAVVMNAASLQALLTPKASGSGQYLNIGSPFTSGPADLRLWDVPVVINSNVPANTLVFGAWSQACHVWVREGANLTIGFDGSDFTQNMITLLAEGRFGFTVEVPTWFTKVAIA